MRPRASAVSALVVALVLPACGAAAPAGDPAADAAAAEAVVDAFYAAIGGWDHAALRATATPDFELADDSVLMDMDALIADLEGYRAQGATGRWTLTDRRTEVAGDVAWTRYRNRGDLVVAGQPSTVEWIEIAVLTREGDGAWRIDRLHSTTVRTADEAGGGV